MGLFGLVFWFTSSSNVPSDTTQTPVNGLPVSDSLPHNTTSGTEPGQESNLSIATVDGGTLQTKDFVADPTTVKDAANQGYYYLGYHTASENVPYIISYINTTQYFNIALLQEPIGQVRTQAEAYLMEHLGVSQADLCRLKYMVSVPNRVNSYFASRNLGFSFCPGATPLPQ